MSTCSLIQYMPPAKLTILAIDSGYLSWMTVIRRSYEKRSACSKIPIQIYTIEAERSSLEYRTISKLAISILGYKRQSIYRAARHTFSLHWTRTVSTTHFYFVTAI